MRLLKQSKEDVFKTLKLMLEAYNSNLMLQQKGIGTKDWNPTERTLKMYDDFYEWLQGGLDNV